MAVRWGIVSAGLIASDFTTVLRMLPRSEHQVRALSGIEEKREPGTWTPAPREEGIRVPDSETISSLLASFHPFCPVAQSLVRFGRVWLRAA